MTNPEDEDKRDFYESTLWTSRGIIRYANRYADAAEEMAKTESDPVRAEELRVIAKNCRRVPEIRRNLSTKRCSLSGLCRSAGFCRKIRCR